MIAFSSASEFMLKLYGSARSSATFRVRIALHLKQLQFDYVPVILPRSEHLSAEFELVNPARLIPVLVDGPHRLTQSLAIIEYLDNTRPGPKLLPEVPLDRAYVQAAAQAIACEIHPVNNLRVLAYLRERFEFTQEDTQAWYEHWIKDGLGKLEAFLKAEGRHGDFVLGAAPTVADALLVPQVFNAQRFNCPLAGFPVIMRIFGACMRLPAFEAARPENQPDF
jgi:maleylacetoacetate isomerase